jgi:hypothetical protein
LTKDFSDFEKFWGMQKSLVRKGCQKVDEFEKEHACISSRLKDVIVHLEVLEFQVLCNVLWAKGFAKQINLISNGSGVIVTPCCL